MAKPGLYREVSERVKLNLNEAIRHLGECRDQYTGLFDDPNLAMISDSLAAEVHNYIEKLEDFKSRLLERIEQKTKDS